MTEREQNKLVVDGFLLGLRVVYQAYDINIPGTEDHKLWDLLRDVGSAQLLRKNGDILLFRSPRPRAAAWIVGAVTISTDCHVTAGNNCRLLLPSPKETPWEMRISTGR